MFVFGRDAVRRISKVVRRIERQEPPERRRKTPIHQSSVVRHVKITSTTQTSGRYPGKRLLYDPSAKSWSDGVDVWVVDINGNTPTVSTRYEAVLVGYENDRLVWAIDSTSGGGGGGGAFDGAIAAALDTVSSGTANKLEVTWDSVTNYSETYWSSGTDFTVPNGHGGMYRIEVEVAIPDSITFGSGYGDLPSELALKGQILIDGNVPTVTGFCCGEGAGSAYWDNTTFDSGYSPRIHFAYQSALTSTQTISVEIEQTNSDSDTHDMRTRAFLQYLGTTS